MLTAIPGMIKPSTMTTRPTAKSMPSGSSTAAKTAVRRLAARISTTWNRTKDQNSLRFARPLASMPLPTGYGLQVVGPEGEELLVPVCLPAGFELDSLVLRPAFLPVEDGGTPAAVAPSTTVAAAPVVSRPAESVPPRERLGQAMQLVYGADTPYRAQIDGAGPTGAAPSVDLGGLRPVQRSEATAPHADVVATAGR